MRIDRRWRLAAAVAGVLAVGLVLALIFTGNDAVTSVASNASTSTSLPASSSSTTTTVVLAPATPSAAATTTPSRATTASTAARPRATPAPVPGSPAATTAPRRCSRPAPGSDFDGFGAAEIVIENSEGSHRSCVLTADTAEQQQRGLMGQDDIDDYDGMIFRFPSAAERTFWMRNTRIPLSIAFFGAAGDFVSATDMEPCGDSPQCPTYSSRGAAQYALEVLKGRLPAVGGTAGSRLTD